MSDVIATLSAASAFLCLCLSFFKVYDAWDMARNGLAHGPGEVNGLVFNRLAYASLVLWFGLYCLVKALRIGGVL